MKKFYTLLAVLLAGCASQSVTETPSLVPYTKSVDNKYCMSMNRFKIAQVLEDGALAYECRKNTCSPFDTWVALRNQRGIDYYDDMIIEIPKEKCAVQNGVYKYQTNDDRNKTVPIIVFEYKNNPKSQEEVSQRLDEHIKDSYFSCMEQVRKDKTVKNKEELCQCVSDSIKDSLTKAFQEFLEQGRKIDTFNEKSFSDDLIKATETKCGPLPQALVKK